MKSIRSIPRTNWVAIGYLILSASCGSMILMLIWATSSVSWPWSLSRLLIDTDSRLFLWPWAIAIVANLILAALTYRYEHRATAIRLLAIGLGVASMLLLGSLWVLVPPFPSPDTLVGSSLPTLKSQLGSPQWELTLKRRSDIIPAQSVLWEKSRGVATWRLGASWNDLPVDPMAHPDFVDRTLIFKWGPERVHLYTAADYRVVVPGF